MNKYTEIIITNAEFRFAIGINIDSINHAYDIEIYGSHHRIPRNWDRLPYRIHTSKKNTYIKFKNSVNHLHIKLIVSGVSSNTNLNASLVFDEGLQPDEIKSHLSCSRILLTGCARNCISTIDQSIETLKKIGRYFKDSEILIFENDSTDGTSNRLLNYNSNGIINLIQERDLDKIFPLRTQRLSYARNQLISLAENFDYDYYCTVDLDGILGEDFNINGFFSCFKYLNSWDAVFPINHGIYYDVWAFRHEELWPYDYQREMNFINPQLGDNNILDFYVSRLQKLNFHNLKGWLRVKSAFGGMGIYKSHLMSNGNYFGLSNSTEVCEHTVFHESLIKTGANLYINPEFIIKGI